MDLDLNNVTYKALRIALKRVDGSISKAARILGTSRQTVHKWIKDYDLVDFLEHLRSDRRNEIKNRTSDEEIEIEYED